MVSDAVEAELLDAVDELADVDEEATFDPLEATATTATRTTSSTTMTARTLLPMAERPPRTCKLADAKSRSIYALSGQSGPGPVHKP